MEYLGKRYELVSSENFEDFLIFTGVGYFQRKFAVNIKPVQGLTRNDDGTYTYSLVSTLFSTSMTFTPGVEFEEIRPKLDVKLRTVITLEDNRMTHIQKEESGRIFKHIYDFFPEKMIVTTTAEGLEKTVTRHYVLVK